MSIIRHEVAQGSPEWLALRQNMYKTASRAASMLALQAAYQSRENLLKEISTGIEQDSGNDFVFQRGHEVEEKVREQLNELYPDLFLAPAVLSRDDLLASLDGISWDGKIICEIKQMNKSHFAQVQTGELPELHYPQVQQQLYVSGADYCIFAIGDGESPPAVVLVYPDQEWFHTIIKGWRRFDEDLKQWQPTTDAAVIPATVDAFPSIRLEYVGEVGVISLADANIAYNQAKDWVDRNKPILKSDEDGDFEQYCADAGAFAKTIKTKEKDIDGILQKMKNPAIGVIESMQKSLLKPVRLAMDKIAKEATNDKKSAIIAEAKTKFLAAVNTVHLSSVRFEMLPPDFVAAGSGKKTLKTYRAAIDSALQQGLRDIDTKAADWRKKEAAFKSLAVFGGAEDFSYIFPVPVLQVLFDLPLDEFTAKIQEMIDEEKARIVSTNTRQEADNQPLTAENAPPVCADSQAESSYEQMAEMDKRGENNNIPGALTERSSLVNCRSVLTSRDELIGEKPDDYTRIFKMFEVLDIASLISAAIDHEEYLQFLKIDEQAVMTRRKEWLDKMAQAERAQEAAHRASGKDHDEEMKRAAELFDEAKALLIPGVQFNVDN